MTARADESVIVRRILPGDDAAMERIIRDCLTEFGANRSGCAWDDDLSRFSALYSAPDTAYWVAERGGRVIAGVGIGGGARHPVCGRVCELQKMYCVPEARGTGTAQRLLDTALDFAFRRYDCVYLETFANMLAARRFYARNGFAEIGESLLSTGHSACDVKMARKKGAVAQPHRSNGSSI